MFLGPSGCGKTTTLKMINRLIAPTSGRVLINGEDTAQLNEVDLRRHIGYVIQQIGLFPNMTIEENITVVPRLLGWDKKRCAERARDLMAMVALDPKLYLKRYPRELSGGQQQRIGVIRALAADPPVLLMDEPFGAVDPINRESIQNEFFQMQRQLNKTVIMVSHDIDEAIKLGDRIAVFRRGQLVQYDHPDTLLARPRDEFVAQFVHSTLKRLLLVKAGDAATQPETARVDTPLAHALAVMDETDCRYLTVLDDAGRALGYVTRARTGGGVRRARDALPGRCRGGRQPAHRAVEDVPVQRVVDAGARPRRRMARRDHAGLDRRVPQLGPLAPADGPAARQPGRYGRGKRHALIRLRAGTASHRHGQANRYRARWKNARPAIKRRLTRLQLKTVEPEPASGRHFDHPCLPQT